MKHSDQPGLEELRILVQSVEDYAILVLDPQGRVTTWNRGAERIKGYSAEEIVGEHFSRFYTAEERAAGRPAAVLERARRDGRVEDEGWRVRKDGSLFWANVVVTALYGEGGTLRGFGKVTRDLTERREREAAVAARASAERSERWLRTTLLSIGDAVVVTDAEGVIALVNPVATELMGWNEDECRGRPLEDVFRIVNEQTRAPVESPVARVLREGVIVGLANHTVLLARDGREIPIDDSGAPVRDEAGGLLGVVLVFRDITERRRAAAELESANDRLSFLAEASIAFSSSLDFEDTLRRVARMAVPRLADWCAVDLVTDGARNTLAVAHVDPAKVALAEELRRRYPPRPDAPRGIYAVVRTGRSELYAEITDATLESAAQDATHLALLRRLGMRSAMVVPIPAGGRVRGTITFVAAESGNTFGPAHVALAEELGRRAGIAIENARLYREAERANRVKDEFLATLSHELRTPLNAILGWAQLMRRGPADAAQVQRASETIERNARHQSKLIDDVLDVSRIVVGKLDLDPSPLDLAELVTRAVDDLRPQATSKGVAIATTTDGPIHLLGDPARLQQVIANLLSNAIKFTPRGGQVEATVQRVGDAARVRIADTGVGIAPELLPHLFERFRQADSSTRRTHGGLGLGLSIVRALVEAHGGTVSAESAGEGRGATLTVELPVREAGALLSGPVRDARLDGVRVLVVDDEADARELLASVLGSRGAEVRLAASASAALTELRSWPCDLLVSDIGMPGTDGYDLVRTLREESGPHHSVPAIALTAYATPDDRQRALDAGYQRHLAKPIDAARLVAAAAELVAARRVRGA